MPREESALTALSSVEGGTYFLLDMIVFKRVERANFSS